MRTRVALYALLVAAGAVVLLPYVWMVASSFKPESEIFTVGLNLLPRQPRWQNYPDALAAHPIALWLLNSFVVGIIETVSTVVTAVLAGFAFARLRWWGRDTLFTLYLGAMMVPIQVTLIPSFLIVKSLGLLNSYPGIAALHLCQFFGVFLMRQFLLNIPTDLEDAARIDGCSWARVLWQIVLPISLPAVAALTVFAFTAAWNDFLWPVVVINKPEIMTIQVGLSALRSESTVWSQLLAATTISALPMAVLYVLLQRFFTQGVVMSGIKG